MSHYLHVAPDVFPSANSVGHALLVLQVFVSERPNVFDSYALHFPVPCVNVPTASSVLIDLSILERFIESRPNDVFNNVL